MATEKRLDLISRKALISEYDRVHIGPPGGARKLMEDALTIDSVQVIRCKDCKHWRDGVHGCTDHVKVCEIGFYMVGENGYCVYGERRE